jgi:hypothetical protein
VEVLVLLEGRSYGGLVCHPRSFAIEHLDHVIKATLTLGSGGAPLRQGRDHAPGSFTEGLVELFRRGGSFITQI